MEPASPQRISRLSSPTENLLAIHGHVVDAHVSGDNEKLTEMRAELLVWSHQYTRNRWTDVDTRPKSRPDALLFMSVGDRQGIFWIYSVLSAQIDPYGKGVVVTFIPLMAANMNQLILGDQEAAHAWTEGEAVITEFVPANGRDVAGWWSRSGGRGGHYNMDKEPVPDKSPPPAEVLGGKTYEDLVWWFKQRMDTLAKADSSILRPVDLYDGVHDLKAASGTNLAVWAETIEIETSGKKRLIPWQGIVDGIRATSISTEQAWIAEAIDSMQKEHIETATWIRWIVPISTNREERSLDPLRIVDRIYFDPLHEPRPYLAYGKFVPRGTKKTHESVFTHLANRIATIRASTGFLSGDDDAKRYLLLAFAVRKAFLKRDVVGAVKATLMDKDVEGRLVPRFGLSMAPGETDYNKAETAIIPEFVMSVLWPYPDVREALKDTAYALPMPTIAPPPPEEEAPEIKSEPETSPPVSPEASEEEEVSPEASEEEEEEITPEASEEEEEEEGTSESSEEYVSEEEEEEEEEDESGETPPSSPRTETLSSSPPGSPPPGMVVVVTPPSPRAATAPPSPEEAVLELVVDLPDVVVEPRRAPGGLAPALVDLFLPRVLPDAATFASQFYHALADSEDVGTSANAGPIITGGHMWNIIQLQFTDTILPLLGQPSVTLKIWNPRYIKLGPRVYGGDPGDRFMGTSFLGRDTRDTVELLGGDRYTMETAPGIPNGTIATSGSVTMTVGVKDAKTNTLTWTPSLGPIVYALTGQPTSGSPHVGVIGGELLIMGGGGVIGGTRMDVRGQPPRVAFRFAILK